MSGKLNPLWDDFIIWSLGSEVERGAVTSEAEWSRVKGVSDRTVRRWKDNPEFVLRREEILLSRGSAVPVAVEAVPSDGGSVDEGDYLVVKNTLVEGAKSGNPKYLDMYFRTYGKPFVEEEIAARSASFAGEDLSVLVAEAVVLLGEDVLVDCLRSAGWKVER
jgi:hypothetical protein